MIRNEANTQDTFFFESCKKRKEKYGWRLEPKGESDGRRDT